MSKLIFIDTETTGTDENIHGIHQISGLVEIDGIIKETFDFKFRPFDDCVIEPKALEINNLSTEIIMNYPLSEKDVYEMLSTIFNKYVFKFDKKDKFTFLGYNAQFDKKFIDKMWLRNNDKFLYSFLGGNPIDILSLFSFFCELHNHKPENFKLMTAIKTLEIPIDETKLHDASYDILQTYNVFKTLVKVFSKNISNQNNQNDIGNDFLKSHVDNIQPINTTKNKFQDLNEKINFGKHQGLTFQAILDTAPGYILWLHRDKIKGIQFDADTITLAEKYHSENNETNYKQNNIPSGRKFVNYKKEPRDLNTADEDRNFEYSDDDLPF